MMPPASPGASSIGVLTIPGCMLVTCLPSAAHTRPTCIIASFAARYALIVLNERARVRSSRSTRPSGEVTTLTTRLGLKVSVSCRGPTQLTASVRSTRAVVSSRAANIAPALLISTSMDRPESAETNRAMDSGDARSSGSVSNPAGADAGARHAMITWWPS